MYLSASELKVLVAVAGVREAKKDLLDFDAWEKSLFSDDPTVTLRTEIDRSGFEEFEALKSIAEEPVVAHLRADTVGLDAATAKLEALRATAEVPITQKVKLDYEVGEMPMLGAVGEAVAGRSVAGASGVESQADITRQMIALRQWQNSHETFWGTTGAPGSVGNDVPDVEDTTAHVHMESSGVAATLSQLQAVREMAATPIVQEVRLHVDKSSLAALGAEEAAASAVPSPSAGGGSSGSGGGGSSFWGSFWGSGGGDSGGGGGGGFSWRPWWAGHLGPKGSTDSGGEGIGQKLLWGGGGMLGLGAGFGSVGSFAGLGPEHLLMTALGIGGSATGAALGGGVLAGGALGTMAVGGGSDLAVMKSTIADTTTLGEKYIALQQAIKLYGSSSKQAAKASAELHMTERELGPIAGAELQLAKSATALDHFWDEQTQKARQSAVKIMEQGVGLGHDYVPLIGEAAATNLAIMNKDLKPLFAWLEGPEGMGIFEHLEEVFAKNLPTSMHALDMGVQFIAKSINFASNYTGGFVEVLNRLLTKANSPEGFAKWEATMQGWIGDFHVWVAFFKELGRDLYDLFSQDAHTGNAIIETLTTMLAKAGEWERSIEGRSDLHNIFTVHKEEVLELLHVIPPLISAIEPIYMTVAPPLVEAMSTVLRTFSRFLQLIDDTGPLGRWAVGLGLIGTKLFGFKTMFGGLGRFLLSPFESMLAKAPLIGGFFTAEETATDKLTGATEGLTTAVDNLTASYEAMGTAASDAQLSMLGGTTTAEEDAAAAGQMSMFPMGAGLAPTTVEKGAADAGVADVAGGGLLAGIGSKVTGFAGDIAASPFAKAGAVAAGYFAAEFGAKLIAPGALEGQSLEQALFHGFNTEGVAKTEAKALAGTFLREINHALAEGGEPSGLEGASHNRARTITKEQTDAMRSESSVLESLQSGMVTRIGDIEQLAREGSVDAAAAFGEGSPQWRKASADNLEAAIESVKAGERAGLISTEEGQVKIAHYLREYNLVSGDDPFHIASAFTQTWAKAGHVSEAGISKALAELRKMPPASQAVAEQTMLRQVKAFEKGGEVAKGTFSRLRSAITAELTLTREHGGEQVELFASEMEGSFGTLSVNIAHALENIGVNVGGLLEKLGAHNPLQSFTLKYLHGHGVSEGAGSKYLGQVAPLGKQRGGHIDLGAPSGDSVPALLERGEYVLNRNAVAAVGTQHLDAINYGTHARFQTGGHVGLGPEPQLQGPQGAMLSLGDAAIHMGYAAAKEYLGAHGAKGHGGAGSIDLSGLEGNRFKIAAEEVRRAHAPHLAILALFEALIDEGGPFSNVLEGEGAGVGARIMSAAKEIAGFLTGTPTWTGNGSAIGLATAHPGMPAYEIAQIIQASGAGAASRGRENYGTHQAEAEAMMARYGYAEGGLVDLASVAHHPRTHLTPEQHQAYLAWKWGRHLAEGGLIGREEERRGVPNSTAATAAKKAKSERESRQTPTEIVHWAMQHIGQSQPWDSEYPGEWCGDFLADDFRSHGMEVPSGYPSAASWGNYGTALGRAHMQAGAVIDYDGQHVALAIGSSEMIQGNDEHGVVGTSEIVGSVGGSPITAVRWPPYSKGNGPGAGSKPTETVPDMFHGAHAAKTVPLPSVPKTLHGIAVEMHKWQGELQTYEHAVHLATGRPKTQRALQANVTRIQKYLRELERARAKLRKEEAKKHFSHHLVKQLGKITGEEKNIELAERGYEVAGQYAEQVVGLEPTEPILRQAPEEATEAQVRQVEEANHQTELGYLHSYEAYVEGRERPAYEKVLGAEAEWRNTILGAEDKAAGMETNWEGRIWSDDRMIAGIPKHFDHIKDRVDDWRGKHPKKKLPTILGREWEAAQYEMTLLPELRFQDRELRKSLGEARQAYYPGFPKALQPPQPPIPNSGEFEQQLQEVQGIHPRSVEHEHLAAASLAPPRQAGSFGGDIWDTQTAIEELGLKITQAQAGIGSVAGPGSGTTGTSAAESERTALLEELLKQANERAAIGEIERETLSAAHILPYAGAYEAGGPVAAMVGEKGPEIVMTRPGAYIHNASESRSMMQPKVVVNHYEAERHTEVEIDDEKVEAVVNRMQRRGARTARRGLARAGQ